MTRFEQELSGELGAFWKKDAQKRIKDMENSVENGEIILDLDGAIRWKSNERVVPKHCREVLAHSCYRGLLDEDACEAAEDVEIKASIESYREMRRNYVPSDEELFEMRAAFGEGSTVVDVITGKAIRL